MHRRKFNIMDNMIQKLEKYANNLEEIVETRTEELVERKEENRLTFVQDVTRVIHYGFLYFFNNTINFK